MNHTNISSKNQGLGERIRYKMKLIEDTNGAKIIQQPPINMAKSPVMDSPPFSPNIELLNVEHKLELTKNRLIEKRKDFVLRKKNLEFQWNEINVKEEALKKNFMIFNQFLQSNLMKRERTLRNIQIERENIQTRSMKLDYLRREYDDKLEILRYMLEEIKKHEKYQIFLEDVVSFSEGQFMDINEISKRVEMLFLTREISLKNQSEQLRDLDNSKKMLLRQMESKVLQIMGYNNSIVTIRSAYENARNRIITLENTLSNIKEIISKYAVESTCNRKAINNLHNHMRMNHKMIKFSSNGDVFKQLLEIKQILNGAKRILKLQNKKILKSGK